ncbi:hypothetical protein BDFG_07546 [Blastomyces dermatitidis ATCC 26199]|nr:hypothetical protein BDFG_07546 [Blastomyces dermatitidis ATCC 26199]
MLRSLFSFVYQNPFTSTSLSTPETSSIEKKTDLFPIVDPAVDGPDCDQDCADCTIKFPARFKLNSNTGSCTGASSRLSNMYLSRRAGRTGRPGLRKLKKLEPNQTAKIPHPVHPSHHKLTTRPWPRDHLILLCSHNRRDARCGISAPLIRRELERHLRPLGLYRDEDDTRPGGVGILYCVPCGRAQVRRERVDISARGGADDLAG